MKKFLLFIVVGLVSTIAQATIPVNVGPNIGVFTQVAGGCSPLPAVVSTRGSYYAATASTVQFVVGGTASNVLVVVDVMNNSGDATVLSRGLLFTKVAYKTSGAAPTTTSVWVSTGNPTISGVIIATITHPSSVDSGGYILEISGLDVANGMNVVVATFTGISAGSSTQFVTTSYTSSLANYVAVYAYGNEQDATTAHASTGPGGAYSKPQELLNNTSALFTQIGAAIFSVKTTTTTWTGASTDGTGAGVILRASCLQ